MKVDLAVVGQGAVTPAGIGIEALLHRAPVVAAMAPLGRPDETWPVLRVDMQAPAFARWQREPRLRRASSMTFFLVEAAAQAQAGVGVADRRETGLIVAFSEGCLAYSRRFFEGVLKQGQKSASPALFPETVFNSPVSHVATVLGLDGAAYALVGDECAWVAAIKTASIWLQRGRVQQVLILGAEEFDRVVLDAYRCAGWLRRQKSAHGFLTSEGAAGILVRSASSSDSTVISAAHDGMIYRKKSEATASAEQLLAAAGSQTPCYPTAGHNWLRSLERNVTADREVIPDGNMPYLGEAITASAAWNSLRAIACLGPNAPRILLPVWGPQPPVWFIGIGTAKIVPLDNDARRGIFSLMTEITLDDVRKLLVDNCMLRVPADEIQPETLLFGPDSLGLDSIDALQLTVGIEKSYGIAITEPAVAREAFQSVKTLRQWLGDQPRRSPAA